MAILYPISLIGWTICFIMVLIPLFKTKGVGHGILGIICGLYTFIWGWINAKQLNLTKVMLVWTICFGLMLVSGMFMGASVSQQVQEAIQKAQQEQQQK